MYDQVPFPPHNGGGGHGSHDSPFPGSPSHGHGHGHGHGGRPGPHHPGHGHGGPRCGPRGGVDDLFELRVVAMFVIFAMSTLAALVPILAAQARRKGLNPLVSEFLKHFGSGVIISTAFIHLLAPAFEAFHHECLPTHWRKYPWAEFVAMSSVLTLFFAELAARRSSLQPSSDNSLLNSPPSPERLHTHEVDPLPVNVDGQELTVTPCNKPAAMCKVDAQEHEDDVQPQLIGVAILEFGVVFHSIVIGLALATDPGFLVLFGVLTCHQSFEGLSLGARLADLNFPPHQRWIRYAGAALFGVSTPIGMALGLILREVISPHSPTALLFSGLCDAMSAGILLYTGLVELLAHEFLANPKLDTMTNRQLAFSCCSMLFGVFVMALLGRWA